MAMREDPEGSGGKKSPSKRTKTARGDGSTPGTTGPSCPVVGIGASAGGLDSFTRLLRALPAHVGMAFVLVQHLDPTHESMLADILGRDSKMPVSEATDGITVEPDHVYVMPPNVSISMAGGSIKLTARGAPPAHVLPIDTFFQSLARECAGGSIGIVLSGTGSDGVLGLASIREAGGLTFAQDPGTADYAGMPRAAIDAGVVDAALAPEDIAAELARLGKHSDFKEARAVSQDATRVDEQSLSRILTLVRTATGLDLTHYRRTTLLRRVARRMLLKNVATMSKYLDLLQSDPGEVQALYSDVLVNMTAFFRDPDAIDALAREVFPKILERKGPDGPFRIWVPGCAKGQEAYTIVIALFEYLETQPGNHEIQMFATDVNERDIETARAGVYPKGIAGEVSAERLARFFTEVPSGYQIDRAIRERCVFAVHDVTKDPPFSKLDLVSFRNVLIYMERPLQERVLQVLHYALEPGGFLLLGASETAGPESSMFSVVDKKHRIYVRKPGPARLLRALAPSAKSISLAGKEGGAEPPVAFDALAAAEEVVLGGYQPSGVLINADMDVIQFRGRLGPFLDPAEGPPTLKLSRLLPPVLATTAEAAIREASKHKVPARRRGLLADADGQRRDVDVEAVPIESPTGDFFYLVMFSDRPAEVPDHPTKSRADRQRKASGDDIAQMSREVDEAREQLETVVAERDAATIELRSASERFQSTNEELRTINEEFQTAQEELQSTNEELTTLNDELRDRNVELGHLTDDLNNVIESVEIPILILGSDLRILRYTPQAEAIVNIVPSDIGRPITDLNLKVDFPAFNATLLRVLRNKTPTQSEVQNSDGHWFSMRVRPYRTDVAGADGVVVAFIDVDKLKRTTELAEAARDHAEAVVETVREPLVTLGLDLRVRTANDAFYETFATSPKETIGVPLHELGDGQWDFPQFLSLLERVIPGKREITGFELERVFPRVGRRIMRLSARRVREQTGEPAILLAIDDVTVAVRRQQLSMALNDIGETVASTLQFDRVLKRILKDATEALGADSATLLLKQDSGWVVKSAFGLPVELIGRALASDEVPVTLRSIEAGGPVLVPDLTQSEEYASSIGISLEHRAVLMIPLLLRDKAIGSLSFHMRGPEAVFSDAEQDFGRRLGTILAFALENAELYSAQREIADTLQAALLSVPRRMPGVDVGYLYRSATTSAAVGGDFYDLFELDENRVGILIGDVSGKGVKAATLTALVKNSIRALAYENSSPASVMRKANDVILKATPSSVFVTMLFCILDSSSGRLVYCSAGHTRAILKRKRGGIELLEVGSPIAGAFGGVRYEDGETTLERGDTLVLYTDGVTEARVDGELFGEERLVEFIRDAPGTRPKRMPQAIFDEVMRYTGGKLSDDVAIVSVTRRASK